MTYYGRWTYKYEIGAEKGAAGVLLIHETEPAGYPFDVVQGEGRGAVRSRARRTRTWAASAIEGWITLDQARKALLQLAGQDFDDAQGAGRDARLHAGAARRHRVDDDCSNTLRTIDSRNVVAKLEGRDPELQGRVRGLHRALGSSRRRAGRSNGDTIYNGANDNAVGTAGLLEIARAFTKLPTPPKRSILFLAVTAEEQGLLGSQYYAVTPLYPLAKTAANINMDGLNVNGRTSDLTLVGYGASELDDYARDAAGEQGRIIRPRSPSRRRASTTAPITSTSRSRACPALDPDEGIEYVGKPADFGRKMRDDYTEHDYHQPSDIVKPDWDLTGAREDLKVFFAVGYRVAERGQVSRSGSRATSSRPSATPC